MSEKTPREQMNEAFESCMTTLRETRELAEKPSITFDREEKSYLNDGCYLATDEMVNLVNILAEILKWVDGETSKNGEEGFTRGMECARDEIRVIMGLPSEKQPDLNEALGLIDYSDLTDHQKQMLRDQEDDAQSEMAGGVL